MKGGSYSEELRMSESSILRGDKSLLIRLDIELTQRCNNNCIHCCINVPANDDAAKNRELSTEEIKNILEEAVSLGCLTVRLTGGEPLLRKDFEDIYLFARKAGLRVSIYTNATLITPRLAELFAHVPPLEKVEITVYGMKKESYRAVTRIPVAFEAAWRGINLLLEKNVPFIATRVLLPPNMDEMDEFEKWTSTIPGMDILPPTTVSLDLRCHRDSEEKNRLIKELRLSPDEVLSFLKREEQEYLKGMKMFCSRFMTSPGDGLFGCGAGIKSGYVNAYGYFQPCALLRHQDAIYDLKNGSLKDALTNFFPAIRQMKATNPDYLARCARCFLRGICQQCPGKSWGEHGALGTTVEYLCETAHVKARYFGLLGDDEVAWSVENGKERLRIFSEEETPFTETEVPNVE